MKRRITKKAPASKKVPALSRRGLDKFLADLVARLEAHALDLEAIQHANRENDSDLVVERLTRMAFLMALDHQANRLRDIKTFAKIIHEAATRKAVQS